MEVLCALIARAATCKGVAVFSALWLSFDCCGWVESSAGFFYQDFLLLVGVVGVARVQLIILQRKLHHFASKSSMSEFKCLAPQRPVSTSRVVYLQEGTDWPTFSSVAIGNWAMPS